MSETGGKLRIQDPQDIELNASTRSILAEVGEAIRKLEPLRPLSPDIVARIQTEMLPQRIVATLNMEGISATKRQTLLVMDAMRVRDAPNRENQEIANALEANQFIVDSVDLGVELTGSLMRETNRRLLQGIRSDAGEFRTAPVQLIGAPFAPAVASDIPSLIDEMCSLYGVADSCDVVLQAAWIHAQFTMVHPFSDGNGRTGRMLQDYSLTRRGLLPVGVPSSQRDTYYGALESADKGDWNPLVELLASLELSTIIETEAIATEPARRSAWIKKLSDAATAKIVEDKKRRYVIWKACIESVVRELEAVVSELNSTGSPISAEIKHVKIPSIEVWKSLQEAELGLKVRLLSLVFDAEGIPFHRIVLYLQEHVQTPSDLFESQPDLVAIYCADGDPRNFEDSQFEGGDGYIRLREILFVSANLYTYMSLDGNDDLDCRDDFTVGEVVESVFEDIFQRKAGVLA